MSAMVSAATIRDALRRRVRLTPLEAFALWESALENDPEGCAEFSLPDKSGFAELVQMGVLGYPHIPLVAELAIAQSLGYAVFIPESRMLFPYPILLRQADTQQLMLVATEAVLSRKPPTSLDSEAQRLWDRCLHAIAMFVSDTTSDFWVAVSDASVWGVGATAEAARSDARHNGISAGCLLQNVTAVSWAQTDPAEKDRLRYSIGGECFPIPTWSEMVLAFRDAEWAAIEDGVAVPETVALGLEAAAAGDADALQDYYIEVFFGDRSVVDVPDLPNSGRATAQELFRLFCNTTMLSSLGGTTPGRQIEEAAVEALGRAGIPAQLLPIDCFVDGARRRWTALVYG